MNILKIIILIIIVSICMYTDIKEHKIKNKYLIAPLAAGIILSFVTNGTAGLKDSLIGIIIPFTVFLVFFASKMFGAGDIKLFCVIGALMGSSFIINNIIYSFLLCFVIIILYLIVKHRLFKYLKYFFMSLSALIFTKNINKDIPFEKTYFPFAGAIFAGTILQLVIRYNFI